MSSQNKINYLKSCIEYDSSSKSLLDIFSPRIEHRIFISERERLLTCSFKTYVDYRLAGTNIDIVASDGRKTVGIDLIGFPGRFIDAFSLERYLMFKRANLAIYPISYHEWINNRSECINFIHKITDRA
ncbi:MAG: hypothetical protein JW915_11215 [Chitinispirillaceae bacterium]|nr:hypothetical protein [Chitinispirillaceae bacterium]